MYICVHTFQVALTQPYFPWFWPTKGVKNTANTHFTHTLTLTGPRLRGAGLQTYDNAYMRSFRNADSGDSLTGACLAPLEC
jgi:hypothetical protein